jgi:SAM-dependent methyltransferase
MSEIHRILKPGGICYFAAGNRVKFMEAHYRLPLLSVIPKWLGHIYVRLAGKAEKYYETHLSYWGLRKLVGAFEIVDYTKEVVRDPVKYSALDMVRPGSLKQKLSLAVLGAAYWCCPTYIWILRKPK